jgi:diguanylate cyclase (GGDEF)-like protein
MLRENVREGEQVGRYGGEEFLLVMPDVDTKEALAAAERIRALIADHVFPHGEKQPSGKVTISGGVARWPTDGKTVEMVLRCADDALYQAKEAGRNRVFSYKPALISMDGSGASAPGKAEAEALLSIEEK